MNYNMTRGKLDNAPAYLPALGEADAEVEAYLRGEVAPHLHYTASRPPSLPLLRHLPRRLVL